MSITLIHCIEELAANAWPAAVVQVVDGWRLRFNWGVTSRANSVWPNEAGDGPGLDERIATAEDFYARRGLRPRFQMCPAAQPPGLDEALARRGYAGVAHTSVQVADIEAVVARAERPPGSLRPRRSVQVDELDDVWFDTYAEGAGMAAHERAMRRGILERIGPRAGYALARIDDEPVAVGLGVAERGWAGIFCMETLPAFRRQGAATAVLGALAQWGQAQGATRMYLQVMLNNPPALGLYRGAGFEPLYEYFYREGPAPSPRGARSAGLG
jgi:N-acetylglutamate synthase